ncbi:hypothetical protein Q0F98_15310 [Paenibacillus amylolyticus]|nr:hypothetical protein Q0F98_15310 [Paenibacillus amylolyticus]
MKKRMSTLFSLIRRDKYLLLMFSPIFLYYLIFMYLPMPGVLLAFRNFFPGQGMLSGGVGGTALVLNSS